MSKRSETLADRVRQAIAATGLTQTAFAADANLKLRSLQDVLGGVSIDPQMSTLQAISKNAKVSIDELVFGKTNNLNERASLTFQDAADFLAKFADLPPDLQRVVYALVYQDKTLVRELPVLKQLIK